MTASDGDWVPSTDELLQHNAAYASAFADDHLPVRLLYAPYANFLRLILSFSRSVNDPVVSCNAASSSITAGIEAKLAHATRVALTAFTKTSWAPT